MAQGKGVDEASLFPEIASVQQPDRGNVVTHNSVQRNSVHQMSPPGTAEAFKTQANQHAHENFQPSNQLEKPQGGTGTRRQLSNFNINQRMSHSQANQQNHHQQDVPQEVPQSNGMLEHLVNQQSYQHQAYISRQAAANQQILTQSIGDASNASYVFDGGNNQPVTRGDYSQFMKGGLGNTQGGQGGGIFPIDNRSLSNESSPSSKFQRRNLMYKNVRNFNNLYENRSLASKNIEMQDQLRLGGAQKLWNFRRVDPVLPQIYDQRLLNTLQNSNQTGLLINH